MADEHDETEETTATEESAGVEDTTSTAVTDAAEEADAAEAPATAGDTAVTEEPVAAEEPAATEEAAAAAEAAVAAESAATEDAAGDDEVAAETETAAEEPATEEAAPAGEATAASSHTYDELKGMTVVQMREIAEGMGDHDALHGYTTMHKEDLLVALCTALGIEAHEHHEVVGIDKAAVKAKIRALKQEREALIAAKDAKQLKIVRRRIRSLKRKIHKATI
jgi:hypothetical protein